MCLDGGVARKEPARTGFRRRLPLELLPEEQELLEREQERFASKRETLVAGLHALVRQAELEQQLEAATAEGEQALQSQAELEERLARAEAALSKQGAQTSKTKRSSETSERRQQQALEAAEQRARELEVAIEQTEGERRQLEQELDETLDRALDAAVCPRCKQWIAAEEWASELQAGREYVHCGRCGFQPGGTLSNSSVFGYREHDD